jgi:hypothetical protein
MDAVADIAVIADAMQDQSPNNSVDGTSGHSDPGDRGHDPTYRGHDPVDRGHDPRDSGHDPGEHQRLSSLELENKLLKNEVASLNQEMASVIYRAKTAQTGRYIIHHCHVKYTFMCTGYVTNFCAEQDSWHGHIIEGFGAEMQDYFQIRFFCHNIPDYFVFVPYHILTSLSTSLLNLPQRC